MSSLPSVADTTHPIALSASHHGRGRVPVDPPAYRIRFPVREKGSFAQVTEVKVNGPDDVHARYLT
jgi:hypothetical protein